MPFEFATAGNAARESIEVPALRMDSIRERSLRAQALDRVRLWAAAMLIGIVSLGSYAVAREVTGGFHVWLAGRSMATNYDHQSAEAIVYPNALELHALMQRSNFHVTLPVGMPRGEYLEAVLAVPADKPNSLILSYYGTATPDTIVIQLLDPSITEIGPSPAVPGLDVGSRSVEHWRVGDEVVVLRGDYPPGIDAAMKSGMSATTPAAAYAATTPGLSRATIIGDAWIYPVAQRLAAVHRSVVIVDHRHQGDVDAAALAGTPLHDLTDVVLPHLWQATPAAKGAPADVTVFRRDALSSAGAKALAAVMDVNDCDCAFAVVSSDKTAYEIWKIPKATPTAVVKYRVDAITDVVTRD